MRLYSGEKIPDDQIKRLRKKTSKTKQEMNLKKSNFNSFVFRHMKDDIYLDNCKVFEAVKWKIDDYTDYYNNNRYQWGLDKLSPKQYAEYIRTDNYPIKS